MKKLIFVFIVLVISGCFMAAAFMGTLYSRVRSETVPAPELVGMSVDDASKLMKQCDLKLKVRSDRQVYSDYLDEGLIAVQDPSHNSIIKKNRYIEVILSKGSRKDFVPDFTGKTLEQSSYEIGEKHFRLVDIVYMNSEKPEGTVISQTPNPGSSGLVDNRIRLLVSRGLAENRLIMPELRMKPLIEVEALLKSHNLKFVVKAFANQIEDKRILFVKEQYPSAGYVLTSDKIITLRVEERERL